ncbi:hypothetical protein [uncultured Roseobacter sp.]|uniref:hypothetical protein n=1 Tax=uncultured Roseobacter sp. TaxID=114847 RepID=UPI002625A878|nr:hypothetical protein [uncultured Roseobacter sp.]
MKAPISRTLSATGANRRHIRGTAQRRRADDALVALQQRADNSRQVRQLQALQRQRAPVLQAANGGTDTEAELPANVPVMISIENGKIGSVYFDDGRIRGTHLDGPADERGDHDLIQRYNIDMRRAYRAYSAAVTARTHKKLTFEEWISVQLWTDEPTWVIEELPAPADMTEGPADRNATLFENFGNSDADYAGYHPSRGAGEKKMLSQSDVDSLEHAAEAAAAVTETAGKNRAFYVELMENAPQLATEMRMPEEIDAETAEEALRRARKEYDRILYWTKQDWSTGPFDDLFVLSHELRIYRQRIVDAGDDAREALAYTRDHDYRSELTVKVAYEVRAKHATARALAACDALDALQPLAGSAVANFFRDYAEAIETAKDVAAPAQQTTAQTNTA